MTGVQTCALPILLSNGLYDYYWPGYEDSAPLGHNTVCLLTEVAEAKLNDAETIADAMKWLKPRERMVVLHDRALIDFVARLPAERAVQ